MTTAEQFWFGIGLLCAGAANVVAFWIFARMRSIGFKRRWWGQDDFELYRSYWRIAPEHQWSRAPLVVGFILVLFMSAALLMAIKSA